MIHPIPMNMIISLFSHEKQQYFSICHIYPLPYFLLMLWYKFGLVFFGGFFGGKLAACGGGGGDGGVVGGENGSLTAFVFEEK